MAMEMPYQLVYVAHPYGGKAENLAKAKRWLRALQEAFPGFAFIAPWIVDCEQLEETPENRARGLRNDCEVIRRCDVFLMCGGEVSAGKERERICALASAKKIVSFDHLGIEPPEDLRAVATI